MKYSKTKIVIATVIAVPLLTTMVLPFNTLRQAKRIMYAHHQYTDFVEMLKNIRGLQRSMTIEAYRSIDPDMANTQEALAMYSWQPSTVVEVKIKQLSLTTCTLQYRFKNNVVSADRLFLQEVKTSPFKITSVNRWELKKI